jgi:hypothetical protein
MISELNFSQSEDGHLQALQNEANFLVLADAQSGAASFGAIPYWRSFRAFHRFEIEPKSSRAALS